MSLDQVQLPLSILSHKALCSKSHEEYMLQSHSLPFPFYLTPLQSHCATWFQPSCHKTDSLLCSALLCFFCLVLWARLLWLCRGFYKCVKLSLSFCESCYGEQQSLDPSNSSPGLDVSSRNTMWGVVYVPRAFDKCSF